MTDEKKELEKLIIGAKEFLLGDEKEWTNILTKSRQKKIRREGANALKLLVNSPLVKEILNPIKIGNYANLGSGSHHIKHLYLTEEGLIEEEINEDWNEYVSDRYVKIKKIKEEDNFSNIAQTYNITKNSIDLFLKSL